MNRGKAEPAMLIEVRTSANVDGGETFSDHVKGVVHAALDRFGGRIRRVDVHLSDAIAHKTGHDDKCCMIELRCDGHEPIVVTHRETMMDQAIHGAVHSLKKAVENAFRKATTQDRHRDQRHKQDRQVS